MPPYILSNNEQGVLAKFLLNMSAVLLVNI